MAGAGNTINYLSLGCQMFSTIISYNKSFNSAANQIKWSTFRKCCHCILVWEHQLSRENRFTHKFSMSYKCQSCLRWNNESLKYWRGGVFWDETWFPSCIIFTKKLFLAPDSALKSIALSYFDGRDLCRDRSGMRSDQYQSAESQFQLFLSMAEHHPPV